MRLPPGFRLGGAGLPRPAASLRIRRTMGKGTCSVRFPSKQRARQGPGTARRAAPSALEQAAVVSMNSWFMDRASMGGGLWVDAALESRAMTRCGGVVIRPCPRGMGTPYRGLRAGCRLAGSAPDRPVGRVVRTGRAKVGEPHLTRRSVTLSRGCSPPRGSAA